MDRDSGKQEVIINVRTCQRFHAYGMCNGRLNVLHGMCNGRMNVLHGMCNGRLNVLHGMCNGRMNVLHGMCNGRLNVLHGVCNGRLNVLHELQRTWTELTMAYFNPLKPELNPICYLLALLGAHHFLHVSRIRVKLLTLR